MNSSAAASETLRLHSPFLPPDFKAKNETPKSIRKINAIDSDRFKLRGLSRIGNIYFFSIFDTKAERSRWVEAGVSTNGFRIDSYDPDTRTIEYSWEGQHGSTQLNHTGAPSITLVFSGQRNLGTQTATAASQQPDGRGGARVLDYQGQAAPTDPPPTTRKIKFQPVARSSSAGAPIGGSSSNVRFVSKDRFAAANPESGNQAISRAPNVTPPITPSSFKVTRRNTVNNASGKRPSHMTDAEWQATLVSRN